MTAKGTKANAERSRKAIESSRRRRTGTGGSVLYGTPTDDNDPAEVLLQEIRRTAGHVAWLQEQITRCAPEEFTHSFWLRNREWFSAADLDTHNWDDAGAIWVELYQAERKHLAAICRTALAAGIEERRVRLAERMAERIGNAIQGMLYDLELDPEDPHVREVVYKWLSAMSNGSEPERSSMAIEGA